MPYYTLHRNHTLATTKGHIIGFKKGVETWVPPVCVPDAVAIGAVPKEPPADEILGEEKIPQAQLTAEQRNALVYAAFDRLLIRNIRGDFTASGLPHPKKVEAIVGFEVTGPERDKLWQSFNEMKAQKAQDAEDSKS